VLASIPRPYEVIRSLIINPAKGKPIEEMTLMKHFEKELHQAQGSVDLLCAKSIKNKIKEGDNFAIGLWARNKFGWDRPGQTMTFSVPNMNGDIGAMDRISNWIDKKPYRFQLILLGHTAVFLCVLLIAMTRF